MYHLFIALFKTLGYICIMSDISVRIKIVMEHYGLSIKEMAEKCDIQRAGLSHILNGRNRPSIAFLTALTGSFNELNPKWLLHGKENMITNVSPELENPVNTEGKRIDTDVSSTVRVESKSVSTDKEIEKIIVFYKDGTFSSYSPDQSL